jgi:NIMA (never in mitosis gene a)-related kinase
MKENNKYFTEQEILNYLAQTCLAIKYIHDRGLCHRDLKPDNIFLTKKNIVKLGDLGVSKVLEDS